MAEEVTAEIVALTASVNALLAAVNFKRAELNALVAEAEEAVNQAALLLGLPSPYDGRMRFTDGTVLLPSMTFEEDTALGLLRHTDGRLGFAVAGVLMAALGSGGFEVNSAITGTAVIQSPTDATAGRLLTTAAVIPQARGGTGGTDPATARAALGAAPSADPTFTGVTTIARIRLTDVSDVGLASVNHAFQIGSTAGLNIVADSNEIQARNNGAAASLNLNFNGGNVNLGDASSVVTINGSTSILKATNGDATAPAFSWASTPDMGMYRASATSIGWAISGANAMTLNATNLLVYGYPVARFYSGSTSTEADLPIGSVILVNSADTNNRNATIVPRIASGGAAVYETAGTGTVLTGTWRARGRFSGQDLYLAQRVA